MKKEHKEIIKLMKTAINTIKSGLDTQLEEIAADLDVEIKKVDGIVDELKEEFEDLSEKQQEGDKGQKLQEEIDNLEDLSNKVNDLKETLEGDFFDDVTSGIDSALED